jgi:hypothetical protein
MFRDVPRFSMNMHGLGHLTTGNILNRLKLTSTFTKTIRMQSPSTLDLQCHDHATYYMKGLSHQAFNAMDLKSGTQGHLTDQFFLMQNFLVCSQEYDSSRVS